MSSYPPELLETEAQRQAALIKLPPPTIEQRENLIAWIDSIQALTMNVFYSIAPDKCWEQEDSQLEVHLPVNSGDIPGLDTGVYCIDLPEHIDDKYRDAVALAYVHLGKVPDDFTYVPSFITATLTKPTAHERMAAKMFFKKLINDNSENQELVDWASQLN